MDDQRLIDYFIEQTNDRFEKLEEKIDEVLKFKWQIIGGSVVLSLIMTVSLQILFRMMG